MSVSIGTGTALKPAKQHTITYGPQLAGVWQKAILAAWAVLFLLSLLSFGLSLTALNIWDRVPAEAQAAYFQDLTPDVVSARVEFQAEVQRLGFSLPVFAHLLTAVRVIGGLPLFILSALVVARYPRSLLGVLFAILLALMGATGILNNPLISWASALTPWMEVPAQVLSAILWFGVFLLFAFPDGRFKPRWMPWLAAALVAVSLTVIFNLDIFLYPGNWPGPLHLTENLVVAIAVIYSVNYRYRRAEPDRRPALKGYVLGVTLLMAYYLIHFTINDIYWEFNGHGLFQSARSIVLFILASEPLWFALELLFVILAGSAIFRKKLLEPQGGTS